jgi:hypothetical protein
LGAGGDSLRNLFAAFGEKYVALDMSGCTGTEIPNTAWESIFSSHLNSIDRPDAAYLVSVVLPTTLTRIGEQAFRGCST